MFKNVIVLWFVLPFCNFIYDKCYFCILFYRFAKTVVHIYRVTGF